MKKLILCFLTGLLSISISILANPSNQHINIDNMNLIASINHRENQGIRTIYDIKIPMLTGTLTPAGEKFNKQVNIIVAKEVDQFTQDAKEFGDNARKNNSFPGATSNMHVDYKIISHTRNKEPFVSIIFSFDSSLMGAAHPNIIHRTLNFDFSNGQVVSMSELFQSNSNYVSIFNNYCAGKLSKKVSQTPNEIKESSALKYDNWNLKPQGILITFDDFPHVIGPIDLLVPYKVIKQELILKIWSKFAGMGMGQ